MQRMKLRSPVQRGCLHDRSASISRVLGVTALMHSADISLPGHASLQAFIGFQAAAIGWDVATNPYWRCNLANKLLIFFCRGWGATTLTRTGRRQRPTNPHLKILQYSTPRQGAHKLDTWKTWKTRWEHHQGPSWKRVFLSLWACYRCYSLCSNNFWANLHYRCAEAQIEGGHICTESRYRMGFLGGWVWQTKMHWTHVCKHAEPQSTAEHASVDCNRCTLKCSSTSWTSNLRRNLWVVWWAWWSMWRSFLVWGLEDWNYFLALLASL